MKFPKIQSLEIAEICGIHAGDGYLRNDGHRIEWDISGSFDEKEYYDINVIPLFSKTFGLEIKGRYFPSRGTYGFVIRVPEIISFANEKLEFPYGNKSLVVKIPSFVIKHKKLIVEFMKGYFDTDGYFGCHKRKNGNYALFKKTYHYYPRVTFSTVSKNLSDDLIKIFDILNIKFYFHIYESKKEKENLKYIFEINGSEKCKFLMELISPKNTSKVSRYHIWKKFGFCPTNISFQERINILNGEKNPLLYYKGL